MIDTIHLLPPDLGPRSNPVLFGISEALASLMPLALPAPGPVEEASAPFVSGANPHGLETSAETIRN